MKTKTKVLFTVILSTLSVMLTIILIFGIWHTNYFYELLISALKSNYIRENILNDRIRFFVFHLSNVIVISLTLIFNLFLIIYFWKNEITFATKEELQKRKEEKKKAKIEKMEKKIERLKDGE